MRNRVARRRALTVALVLVVLTTCSYYVFTGHRRMSALSGSAAFRIDSADAQRSTDPQVLLGAADHFYWLNNGTAAGPLYAQAEKLFSEQGDARNELHAEVGRLRSEAETMSFVELSRFLNEQLQNPIVQNDMKLRLWCLIAKGCRFVQCVFSQPSDIDEAFLAEFSDLVFIKGPWNPILPRKFHRSPSR